MRCMNTYPYAPRLPLPLPPCGILDSLLRLHCSVDVRASAPSPLSLDLYLPDDSLPMP